MTLRTRRFLAATAFVAAVAGQGYGIAQTPKPLAAGDAATGAALHEKDCVACHVRRVGGDGTTMYTRAERKVTTPARLRAQIALCNSELGTNYFPEEEEHVAAYLNLQYYKFKD
jgi:mono/diheme cytochrome c family protein